MTRGGAVTIEARPGPIRIDTAATAVVVVDMQNDFGATGGLFDRAGIDISGIRRVIEPIGRVLDGARAAGLSIVYLKMGYRADLSDLGAADSVNRTRHLHFGVGQPVPSPDGTEGRHLVRDTWNTQIVAELTPAPQDLVVYKTRFSGFYETALDEELRRRGIRFLIFTGCTTSICVDSTVRDAMYRDYLPILLSDCMNEPIGNDLARSNHDASLLAAELLFGWVTDSKRFLSALQGR